MRLLKLAFLTVATGVFLFLAAIKTKMPDVAVYLVGAASAAWMLVSLLKVKSETQFDANVVSRTAQLPGNGYTKDFTKEHWGEWIEKDFARWNTHIRDLSAAGINVADKNILAKEFVKWYWPDSDYDLYPFTIITREVVEATFLNCQTAHDAILALTKLNARSPISVTDGGKAVQNYITKIERDEFGDLDGLENIVKDYVLDFLHKWGEKSLPSKDEEFMEKLWAAVIRHAKILTLKGVIEINSVVVLAIFLLTKRRNEQGKRSSGEEKAVLLNIQKKLEAANETPI